MLSQALSSAQSLVKDGKIPGKYKGYVASFGVSVLQIGLKPTALMFSNTNEKHERPVIGKAIFEIASAYYNKDTGYHKRLPGNSLDQLAKNIEGDDVLIARSQLLNASVALKMAMNTFEFDESSAGRNE